MFLVGNLHGMRGCTSLASLLKEPGQQKAKAKATRPSGARRLWTRPSRDGMRMRLSTIPSRASLRLRLWTRPRHRSAGGKKFRGKKQKHPLYVLQTNPKPLNFKAYRGSLKGTLRGSLKGILKDPIDVGGQGPSSCTNSRRSRRRWERCTIRGLLGISGFTVVRV